MQLAKIIQPDHIIAPLEATEKTAAITALVDKLATAGALTKRDMVLDAVLKRSGAHHRHRLRPRHPARQGGLL